MRLSSILFTAAAVAAAVGFGAADGPIATYFRVLAGFLLVMFSWRLVRRPGSGSELPAPRPGVVHRGRRPAPAAPDPRPTRGTMTLRTWMALGLAAAGVAGGGYFFATGGRVTVAAPGAATPAPPAGPASAAHAAAPAYVPHESPPAVPHAPVVTVSASIPDLPVTLTRRPSTVGRGFVGQLRTTGDTYLRLAVTYKNVTTGRTTTGSVEVGPAAAVELGWLEGYPLATGDTLTLSHPNYKPRSWEF